jgi:RHH-type proline utilization regulon transcriptional repressor/proline dehydrogenase/delta 1-pyrroline-5-carboxylate dehydrogenase
MGLFSHPDTQALQSISAQAFMPESEAVQHLLSLCEPFDALRDTITADARRMVARLRDEGLGVSVEAFLQEYGLSSKEGVAVMCLAEALLRIPDRATADALIDATFDGADWETHLGHSDSLLVNASSWGLLLTGKTLDLGEGKASPSAMLGKLVRSAGEPVIRTALKRAMKLIASQFVMGETTAEALDKAPKFMQKGYIFSYDMLGEGARSWAQAEAYYTAYNKAIEAVGKTCPPDTALVEAPSISIKLTALHPSYLWQKREQVMAELLPKLVELTKAAQAHGIAIAIDAEEANRLDLELEIFRALYEHTDLADYHGIGFVLQAYQKRAVYVLDFLQKLAERQGKNMPVRLVKGAYWDSEIKAAQLAGLPHYPVFTHKAHSDVSYLTCARILLDNHAHFFPQFATHNAMTIAAIRTYATEKAPKATYEFQRLYGMGEKLYEPVVGTVPCRIYAPIGEHKDLLAYLIRRLLENGANSSFVHIMTDKDVPLDAVLADPIEAARHSHGKRNATIPLPADIYGDTRRNSPGDDMGYRVMQEALEMAVEKAKTTLPDMPKVADVSQIDTLFINAEQGLDSWKSRKPTDRAATLEKAADLLEEAKTDALALLLAEGKKVMDDAIAEWREAIDFLRYYAAETRRMLAHPQRLPGPTGEHNALSLHPRGVFVCISPWNFPLAIFCGQVAAALAAGNAVLAKPAEQTPRCAALMVQLLHEAGVPPHALQLVCGEGSSIGAALVAHKDVAGVAFTGSTEVARLINRTLAAGDGPIVPLIAETGGQNVMIIDSSALLEQAVDDVVISAFGSAGQRCSALRVLYIHADIADEFEALLKGAMEALQVGSPTDLATDIPPVIDAEAQTGLQAHLDWLHAHKDAHLIHRLNAPEGDTYLPPHAYAIPAINLLEREQFGPILHIIRYRKETLSDLIEMATATGYGLTFGLHTRIPSRYAELVAQVEAGNLYVNRSMIGATVGVQPFGGEGLSGTGFKAGGPNYLLRFVTERTTTINTAAIGGNIDLLVETK